MYVCSCFGITEEQVREHAAAGVCTPRQIASESGAGTDCGSCVRRIQGILGRGTCPRRAALERGEPALGAEAPVVREAPTVPVAPEPERTQQRQDRRAEPLPAAAESLPAAAESLPTVA